MMNKPRWNNYIVLDRLEKVVNIYNENNELILEEVYFENVKVVEQIPIMIAYITKRGLGKHGIIKGINFRLEETGNLPELREW